MKIVTQLVKNTNTETKIVLLMLDIDHFKSINDNYGHLFGDTVLVAVAGVCRNNLRIQDLCCRYGGEEFLILLPKVEPDSAIIIAERIREHINQLTFSGYPQVSVTVSIGICIGSSQEDIRDLIGQADAAMYCAKKSGNNKYEIAKK
jgi:diguanylate cyclase (GGDEF)-like protein